MVDRRLSLEYLAAEGDARPAELLFNQLFGEIFSLSLVLASAASTVGPRQAQGLLAGIYDLDGAVTDVRQALAPRSALGPTGRADVLRSLHDTVRTIAQEAEDSTLSPSRRAAIWDQAFQVRAVLKEVARLSDPVLNRRWSPPSDDPVGLTGEWVVHS